MTRVGVVLMTYGSPRDLDDVGRYLTRIRGGRGEPSSELVAEFRRRYATIGRSPLVEITQQQAAALEQVLGVPARAGMRFSEPSVLEAAREAVMVGAERLVGLILSPQYSPLLMGAYDETLAAAGAELGVPTRTVGAWHLAPAFVRVLAERVRRGLAQFPEEAREQVPILLTAHSLPKRVVDREPGYVEQLKATADAVAAEAGLPAERWRFVYQSAGHTPEEWLKPDLLDVLPELAAAGQRQVLVAPVQFLADHLETLYDIDVAAQAQAAQAGMERLVRAPAPNDDADFIRALADVLETELATWQREAAWAAA